VNDNVRLVEALWGKRNMASTMVVAGTRPEAIKLAPMIQWLQKLKVDTTYVWSGQHYDYELSEVFFEQFGLSKPEVDLQVGKGSHAEQTGKTMIRLEKTITQYGPSLVVAEGDTNTVATVALTAVKARVPFAHLEAGLRSYDRTMPEEINRLVADSLSELLFAPTKLASINLAHEGIPLRKIHLTGNTIVDVVAKYKETAYQTGIDLLKQLNVIPHEYLLVTLHRQENTDNSRRLSNVVKALFLLSKKHRVIFLIHPRTKDKLRIAGIYENLKRKQNLILIPPQGYFEFLGLLMHSLTVLTDSGGVQEEALTLRIPTVTLRYNTERPETVLYGTNVIAGTEPKFVCKLAESQIQKSAILKTKSRAKPNPFGDGNAGRRTAGIIKDAIEAGIEIEESDTRYDPYIVYALVNSSQLKKIRSKAEILAIYDHAGNSQFPVKHENLAANGKILVRAPLRKIRTLQGR
jgi:UDP-N-acetylglucosamine 2-epimerase (non-hydrolysing)